MTSTSTTSTSTTTTTTRVYCEALDVTVLSVPLCPFAAGTRPITAKPTLAGFAHNGSRQHTAFRFTQEVGLSKVEPANSGMGGGSIIELEGVGFGPTFSQSFVYLPEVDGQCVVLESSSKRLRCATPPGMLKIKSSLLGFKIAVGNLQPRVIGRGKRCVGGVQASHIDGSNMFSDEECARLCISEFVSGRCLAYNYAHQGREAGRCQLVPDDCAVQEEDVDFRVNQLVDMNSDGQIYTFLSPVAPLGVLANETGVHFSYDVPAASVIAFTPTEGRRGDVLTFSGSGFGLEVGSVLFGQAVAPGADTAGVTGHTADISVHDYTSWFFECNVTSWRDDQVKCILEGLPAGVYNVSVWVPGVGQSLAPEYFLSGLTITEIETERGIIDLRNYTTATPSEDLSSGQSRALQNTSKTSAPNISLRGGFGGGVSLKLRGDGFGVGLQGTSVKICGEPCEVISSTYGEVVCVSPEIMTPEFLTLAPREARELEPGRGVVIAGEPHVYRELSRAFDHSLDENVQLQRHDCSLGIDADQGRLILLTEVAFYAPPDLTLRELLLGGAFVVNNFSSVWEGPKQWTIVSRLRKLPTTGWNMIRLAQPIVAQRIRFLGADAELLQYSLATTTTTTPTTMPPYAWNWTKNRTNTTNITNCTNYTPNGTNGTNWTICNYTPEWDDDDFATSTSTTIAATITTTFMIESTNNTSCDINNTNNSGNCSNYSVYVPSQPEQVALPEEGNATEYQDRCMMRELSFRGFVFVAPLDSLNGGKGEMETVTTTMTGYPEVVEIGSQWDFSTVNCDIEVGVRDPHATTSLSSKNDLINIAQSAVSFDNGTVRLEGDMISFPLPGSSVTFHMHVSSDVTTKDGSFLLEVIPVNTSLGPPSVVISMIPIGGLQGSQNEEDPQKPIQGIEPLTLILPSQGVNFSAGEAAASGELFSWSEPVPFSLPKGMWRVTIKPVWAETAMELMGGLGSSFSTRWDRPKVNLGERQALVARMFRADTLRRASFLQSEMMVRDAQGSLAAFEYKLALTPLLLSVSPDRGPVSGGTDVSVTGQGFFCEDEEDPPITLALVPGPARIAVSLGDVACTTALHGATHSESESSDREFRCRTGERPRLHEGLGAAESQAVSVHVVGCGRAVHVGPHSFTYLERWSKQQTWLHGEPPIEGDSVVISASKAVILDVAPPRLENLTVHGLLTFEADMPLGELSLSAARVAVHGGALEIGREEAPLRQPTSITLSSFGRSNKSSDVSALGQDLDIASIMVMDHGSAASTRPNRRGRLDVHAKSLGQLTSVLDADALDGTVGMKLSLPIDARPGDTLVVSGGSPAMLSESIVIKDVAVGGRFIQSSTPLQAKHYGSFFKYATKYNEGNEFYPKIVFRNQSVDMRASVAVTRRDISIRGGLGSPGALVSCAHASGACRLDGVEFTQCGRSAPMRMGVPCVHLRASSRVHVPLIRRAGVGFREGGDDSEEVRAYARRCAIQESLGPGIIVDPFAIMRGSITGAASMTDTLLYHNYGHGLQISGGESSIGHTTVDRNIAIEMLPQMTGIPYALKPAAFVGGTRMSVWRDNRAAGVAIAFLFDPREDSTETWNTTTTTTQATTTTVTTTATTTTTSSTSTSNTTATYTSHTTSTTTTSTTATNTSTTTTNTTTTTITTTSTSNSTTTTSTTTTNTTTSTSTSTSSTATTSTTSTATSTTSTTATTTSSTLLPDQLFDSNVAHECDVGLKVNGLHREGLEWKFKQLASVHCGHAVHVVACDRCRVIDSQWLGCESGVEDEDSQPFLGDPPQYQRILAVGTHDAKLVDTLQVLPQMRLSKQQHFFLANMTFVNFGENPVLHGGYRPVTVKVNDLHFPTSLVPLLMEHPAGKSIFKDLDGSLSGYAGGYVVGLKKFLRHPECSSVGSVFSRDLRLHCSQKVLVRSLQLGQPTPVRLAAQEMLVTSIYGSDSVQSLGVIGEGEGDWWEFPVFGGEYRVSEFPEIRDFQYPAQLFNEGGPIPEQWRMVPLWYTLRVHGNKSWETLRVRYGGRGELAHKEFVGINFVYDDLPAASYFDAIELEGACRPNIPDPEQKRLFRMPLPGDGCGAMSMMSELCTNRTIDPRPNGSYLRYTNESDGPLLESFLWKGTLSMMMGSFTGTDDEAASLLLNRSECPSWGCKKRPQIRKRMGPPQPWSDENAWPDYTVPGHLANVVIGRYYHVVLDVDTPPLGDVIVYGTLEWNRETNSTLICKSLRVWGTLQIGTKADPVRHPNYAVLALWGNRSEIIMRTFGSFVGTKAVAVLSDSGRGIGRVNMHGQEYAKAWVRLTQTAENGVNEIHVDGNVEDWPWAATIAIGPTEYIGDLGGRGPEIRHLHEVRRVSDKEWIITLDRPLDSRHYVGKFVGGKVSMSAAVALLDRNVIVTTYEAMESADPSQIEVNASRTNILHSMNSSDEGGWHGAHVVVDGGANMSLSWMKFKQAGQDTVYQAFDYDGTPFAALKHMTKPGSDIGWWQASPDIIGIVFEDCHGGGGLQVRDTMSFSVEESVSVGVRGAAIEANSGAKNMKLLNNLAVGSRLPWRHSEAVRLTPYEPTAAFRIDVVPGLFKGNVAAGGEDIGFQFRPAPCTSDLEAQALFGMADEANEAYACIVGFFILRSCHDAGGGPKACNQTTCVQATNLVAYKNSHIGIVFVDQPSSLKINQVKVSDNHIGITGSFHRQMGDTLHFFDLQDSVVLGSTGASGCEASVTCRTAGFHAIDAAAGDRTKTCHSSMGYSIRRVGILMPVITNRGKTCEDGPVRSFCIVPNTPDRPCALPWEQRYGTGGSRMSLFRLTNMIVGEFPKDDCGRSSRAITFNPSAHDWSPWVESSGFRWADLEYTSEPNYSLSAEVRAELLQESLLKLEDDIVKNSQSSVFLAPWSGNNRATERSCGSGTSEKPGCPGRSSFWLRDLDGSYGGVAGQVFLPTKSGILPSACIEPAPTRRRRRYDTTSFAPETIKCSLAPRILRWESADNDCCGFNRRKFGGLHLIRQRDKSSQFVPPVYDDTSCPRGVEYGREYYTTRLWPDDSYDMNFDRDIPLPRFQRLYFFSDIMAEYAMVSFRMERLRKVRVFVNGLRRDNYERPNVPSVEDTHGAHSRSLDKLRFNILMRGHDGCGVRGCGNVFLQYLEVIRAEVGLGVSLDSFNYPPFLQGVARSLGIDVKRVTIVGIREGLAQAIDFKRAQNTGRRLSYNLSATSNHLDSLLQSFETVPVAPQEVRTSEAPIQLLSDQQASKSMSPADVPAARRLPNAPGNVLCTECTSLIFGDQCGQSDEGTCQCGPYFSGTQCDDVCNCRSEGALGCLAALGLPVTVNRTCSCKPHWGGSHCEECEIHWYHPFANCSKYCDPAITCSGQGKCDFDAAGLPIGCRCDAAWAGQKCDICAPSFYPAGVCNIRCGRYLTCYGKGTCSDAGLCVCELGWGGSKCDRCADGWYPTRSCNKFASAMVMFEVSEDPEAPSMDMMVGAPTDSSGAIDAAAGAEPPTRMADYHSILRAMRDLASFLENLGSSQGGKAPLLDTGYLVTSDQLTLVSVPPAPVDRVLRKNCTLNEMGHLICTCQKNWYGFECDKQCVCFDWGTAGCFDGPTGNGSCICALGWKGEQCDGCFPNYYKKQTNCSSFCHPDITCSGKGQCVLDEVTGLPNNDCECVESRVGADCTQCAPGYYPPGLCDVTCDRHTKCSGHGSCNWQGNCICDTAWTGARCNECAPKYYPKRNCTIWCGAANCEPPSRCNRFGECYCTGNRWGETCSNLCPRCKPSGTIKCDAGTMGSGRCLCYPGWGGAMCHQEAIWKMSQWSDCTGQCGGLPSVRKRDSICKNKITGTVVTGQGCATESPPVNEVCLTPLCACGRPPLIDFGDNEKNARECGYVLSGKSCVGFCQQDYVAFGTFKCSGNQYSEIPRCITSGRPTNSYPALFSVATIMDIDLLKVENLTTFGDMAKSVLLFSLAQYLGPSAKEENFFMQPFKEIPRPTFFFRRLDDEALSALDGPVTERTYVAPTRWPNETDVFDESGRSRELSGFTASIEIPFTVGFNDPTFGKSGESLLLLSAEGRLQALYSDSKPVADIMFVEYEVRCAEYPSALRDQRCFIPSLKFRNPLRSQMYAPQDAYTLVPTPAPTPEPTMAPTEAPDPTGMIVGVLFLLGFLTTVTVGILYYFLWHNKPKTMVSQALPPVEDDVWTASLDPQYIGGKYPMWTSKKLARQMGFGERLLPDHSQYVGFFKWGRANGEGRMTWQDNRAYQGEWWRGSMHGQGVMRSGGEDGEPPAWVYSGQFQDNLRHGFGRCEWAATGIWYDGDWFEGMPHGLGESGCEPRMTSYSKAELPPKADIWLMEGGVRKDPVVKDWKCGQCTMFCFSSFNSCASCGNPRPPVEPIANSRVAPGDEPLMRVVMKRLPPKKNPHMTIEEDNKVQVECPRLGIVVGHPDAWLPSVWGALVLTQIEKEGPLAKWNQGQSRDHGDAAIPVLPNALIWRVGDIEGDAHAMVTALCSNDFVEVECVADKFGIDVRNPPHFRYGDLRTGMQFRKGWVKYSSWENDIATAFARPPQLGLPVPVEPTRPAIPVLPELLAIGEATEEDATEAGESYGDDGYGDEEVSLPEPSEISDPPTTPQLALPPVRYLVETRGEEPGLPSMVRLPHAQQAPQKLVMQLVPPGGIGPGRPTYPSHLEPQVLSSAEGQAAHLNPGGLPRLAATVRNTEPPGTPPGTPPGPGGRQSVVRQSTGSRQASHRQTYQTQNSSAVSNILARYSTGAPVAGLMTPGGRSDGRSGAATPSGGPLRDAGRGGRSRADSGAQALQAIALPAQRAARAELGVGRDPAAVARQQQESAGNAAASLPGVPRQSDASPDHNGGSRPASGSGSGGAGT
jgi:hypothetical protein